MATYAIGDVQGCYDALRCLLDKISFDATQDHLWFAGDLINRGPDSLASLRFIKSLNATVVLGNHDLHLLACHYASEPRAPKRKDTLKEILDAPDRDELLHWLKQQPLMVWDQSRHLVMTHAGLPHIWSTKQAFKLNREVQAVLQSDDCAAYFDNMYGNDPDAWSEDLTGTARLRVITNYFTRMRFVTEQGNLDFAAKETIESAPKGYRPWFEFESSRKEQQVFGHWAALSGVSNKEGIHALDTGCVWNGELTAMNIDTGKRISCDCQHDKGKA